MSSALERLPNELLDHIISYLATEPPSLTQFHRPPTRYGIRSQTRSLKHLAQVSSQFLNLVRPRLFTYACLELEDELDFISFIIRSGLGRYVTSLVAITVNASADPADQGWWRRVLRCLDPACVTVLAPPTFIGNMLNTPIMDGHSWAFDIKLQMLQLERHNPLPDLSQSPDLENCNNLLDTHPWTSLSFNESSSLRAYNHYEYFLSRVPSVIGQWGVQFTPQASPSSELSTTLHGLTHFSYTAVFPFYNHVKLVLDALANMPELRVLKMQLAPDANNHITEVEQRGSMDPNDPWMELATSYSLIGFEVNAKPSLVEFRSGDFHLEAIRSELSQILEDSLGETGWTHDGPSVWKRIASQN
ncbi:hypothetical protein N7476_008604 [Penicillium atrosanguineum]|uniref:F-box domain-containing protein n=1 Tax=Penicillium atrosanguineum TaxID=1132637 RepID=A0A9W9PS24_9EURO|nr:hypothetical protein N7476_008604 [Penicillium atrosanguineum]